MNAPSLAQRLDTLLSSPPYEAYSYSYPHKTAYRALADRPALSDVWAAEDRRNLFLYAHVPFCAMRCGFCNLFTTTDGVLADAWLDAFSRQASVVRDALGEAAFVTGALGGGTPTWLSEAQLQRLFHILTQTMGARLPGIPLSVEMSPRVDGPRLDILAAYGATRVSIGVQSFVDAEVRGVGRNQRRPEVERALQAIRDRGFPTVNLDLIYGLPGQTADSWALSIDAALAWQPEEVFLYPLYVRPRTGLGLRGKKWNDHRIQRYREGRDRLLAAGYHQVSMRMFQRTPPVSARSYRCQRDGMVGLGPGARSYTQHLHWSTEWGVGPTRVKAILQDYIQRPAADFAHAWHGIVLSPAEQQRRHLIQSLLSHEGFDVAFFAERFGGPPDFPEVAELERRGLAHTTHGITRLTPEGLERSDAIGPWLYSARVRQLCAEFTPT